MNKKIIITLVIFLILIISIFGWQYYVQKELIVVQEEILVSQGATSTKPVTSILDEQSKTDIYKDLSLYVWIWKETHRGTGPESLDEGKIVPSKPGIFTLVFSKEGKVVGTTDCNNFSGTYVLSGGKIIFGPFMSTLKFCEGSQESDFIKMIRDGQLSVGDKNLYIEHEQTAIFEKGEKIN